MLASQTILLSKYLGLLLWWRGARNIETLIAKRRTESQVRSFSNESHLPVLYSTGTSTMGNSRKMETVVTELSTYKLIREYTILHHQCFHANLALLIADTMIRIKDPKRSSE